MKLQQQRQLLLLWNYGKASKPTLNQVQIKHVCAIKFMW